MAQERRPGGCGERSYPGPESRAASASGPWRPRCAARAGSEVSLVVVSRFFETRTKNEFFGKRKSAPEAAPARRGVNQCRRVCEGEKKKREVEETKCAGDARGGSSGGRAGHSAWPLWLQRSQGASGPEQTGRRTGRSVAPVPLGGDVPLAGHLVPRAPPDRGSLAPPPEGLEIAPGASPLPAVERRVRQPLEENSNGRRGRAAGLASGPRRRLACARARPVSCAVPSA